MKELELNFKIEELESGSWQITLYPLEHPELFARYIGETREKVLERFAKGMSNPNIKYWYMMEK